MKHNFYLTSKRSAASLIAIFIMKAGYCQCPLTPAACAGTALLATDGNKTIPPGTTYYIPAGTTYTGNITFADATSKLCIEGTWTGKPAESSPGGGTINVYGTINNATNWSFSGGGLTINVFAGGQMTIKQYKVSGGTHTITNCGDITFSSTGDGIYASGGTYTINNYAAINVTGSISSSTAGFTFNNYTGSQIYVGDDVDFSNGTYLNEGNLCVTSNSGFSSGSFINDGCFRTTSYNISGDGAFTNNGSLTIVGNFSNSGDNNINNGRLTITGNFSNSGQNYTNNGILDIAGDFDNSGANFTLGDGSIIYCTDWDNSGSVKGPATGCGSIRATGYTHNSATFVALNSNKIDFWDTGNPALDGTPAIKMDSNSGDVKSTTNTGSCTPNALPAACDMAGSACTTVLPIELVEFKSDCKDRNIDLFWTTATETNNDYFTIERTKDGSTYEIVGIVDSKAPNGTSTQTLFYTFTDFSFPKEDLNNNPVVYYRLKQTDFDGNYTYSYLVPGTCSSYCMSDLKVLNENNLINFSIQAICNAIIDLAVYNTLGQIIFTQREFIQPGNNTITLDRELANSLYIVKANTKNQSLQVKFVK